MIRRLCDFDGNFWVRKQKCYWIKVMKKYIWIFISAALLETLIFPLRGLYLPTCPYLGHQVCLFMGAILFFLLTVYMLHKYKNRIKPSYVIIFFLLTIYMLRKYKGQTKPFYTVLFLLIGSCILELPDDIYLYIRYGYLTASPPQLLLRWIGIIGGLIYCRMEKKQRKILLLSCGILVIFLALWGNPYWLKLL